MVKLIGALLLIYGLIGVVVTLIVYWLLRRPQGPIEKLRGLLKTLATKLHEGSLAAAKALDLAYRG